MTIVPESDAVIFNSIFSNPRKLFRFLVVSITQYGIVLFHITQFNDSRSKNERFMHKLSKPVYIIEKKL